MRDATRRLILGCGLVFGLAVGGCDNEDAASSAIGEAEASFALARTRDADERAGAFSQAASELSVSGGSASEAEAARLAAQARSAQAWEQMRPATEAAGQLASVVSRIEARLAEVENLHARAASLESFSPSEQLEALRARLAERHAERDALAGELAQARAEQGEFEAGAAEQGALAREAVSREQSLRVEAADADAVGRAQLISQAVQQARVAAEYEQRQGELQLQVDLAEGRVRDLEGKLGLLERSIGSIEGSIQKIEARQDELRAQVAALRGQAGEASESIASLIAEGKALLDEVITPAIDEAVATLGQASSSAARSRSADGTAGKVTAASIDHSLYALESIRAMTLTSFADAVARVAGSPASDGRAAGLAQSLQEAATQAREAAQQAKEQAASSMGSTGVRGDGAGALFERLAASLGGEVAEPDAEADPAEDELEGGEEAAPDAPDADAPAPRSGG